MDHKQFERLQSALQFVVDDDRRNKKIMEEHPGDWTESLMKDLAQRSYRWEQGSWGRGKVTAEERPITGSRRHEKMKLVCPTTGCLAGTIVVQYGDHLIASDEAEPGTIVTTDFCMDAQGNVHEISSRAEELIGGDAGCMFDACRMVEDLIKEATEICSWSGFELDLV